jgi:hypothetical protein
MCGQVFMKERTGTRNLSTVTFRFGAVTKAGGSTVTVSLQNLNLAAGPPGQPDETQDQSVTIANADAGFASNVGYTATLGSTRSIAHGAAVCAVWEFGTFAGADSVIINGINNDPVAATPLPGNALKTGGSWAANTSLPSVVFGFDDGTFGTLDYKHFAPHATTLPNTHTIALDTGSADEYALEFQLPFAFKIDAAWVLALVNSATADFEVILYDGTTPMTNGTVTVDANTYNATASVRGMVALFPGEVTGVANTTYRLAVRPIVNGQSVAVYSLDVLSAGHFQAFPGGTTWAYTTRLNQGAWAGTTTTRRMVYGIRISSLSSGGAGGTGKVVTQ